MYTATSYCIELSAGSMTCGKPSYLKVYIFGRVLVAFGWYTGMYIGDITGGIGAGRVPT